MLPQPTPHVGCINTTPAERAAHQHMLGSKAHAPHIFSVRSTNRRRSATKGFSAGGPAVMLRMARLSFRVATARARVRSSPASKLPRVYSCRPSWWVGVWPGHRKGEEERRGENTREAPENRTGSSMTNSGAHQTRPGAGNNPGAPPAGNKQSTSHCGSELCGQHAPQVFPLRRTKG